MMRNENKKERKNKKMKEILGNADNINIIKCSSNVKKDRNEILSSLKENGSSVVVCCHIIKPNEDVQSYGQAMIITQDTEDDSVSKLYHVYLTALHNHTIVTEALRLALKETFSWFNRNKVKVDFVYVTDVGHNLSSLDFLNLRLVFQYMMKEGHNKSSSLNDASLWLEKVEDTGCSLFMDFNDSKEEKDKKKDKKKKSNKKKNKKG